MRWCMTLQPAGQEFKCSRLLRIEEDFPVTGTSRHSPRAMLWVRHFVRPFPQTMPDGTQRSDVFQPTATKRDSGRTWQSTCRPPHGGLPGRNRGAAEVDVPHEARVTRAGATVSWGCPWPSSVDACPCRDAPSKYLPFPATAFLLVALKKRVTHPAAATPANDQGSLPGGHAARESGSHPRFPESQRGGQAPALRPAWRLPPRDRLPGQ